MEQHLTGADQLKQAAKLMGYDFDIQYYPDKENRVADALSRRNEAMYSLALLTVKIVDVDAIDEAVQRDSRLRALKQDLLLYKDSHPGYSLRKGVLLYKDMLVILPNYFQGGIFTRIPCGGHSRFLKTYKRIAILGRHERGYSKICC